MTRGPRVLVVAATHGNERCAAWLLECWLAQPSTLVNPQLDLALEYGNPAAHAINRRYVDRDLNRCFSAELLRGSCGDVAEVVRARELLALYGPGAECPAAVVLDLHSTTSAMGNSLVLYGRRPADLALAAAIQAKLGLPIYLHEGDASQSGFLIERWPCGLVIEVGPVAQGLVDPAVCRKTQLALEVALEMIAAAWRGELPLPRRLVVHRHRGSLDLPRRPDGTALACLHPLRQGRDWQPMRSGDPLFLGADGRMIPYVPSAELAGQTVYPVFINEAAYGEKGIALSLTSREVWPVEEPWVEDLSRGLQRGCPL
ncbi:MAG: aspartoacylase [Cyanobacteriota bacterium]|nr:aspartoacylase [Cyanobacteriota bacterium]